jgi:hypothetical protein
MDKACMVDKHMLFIRTCHLKADCTMHSLGCRLCVLGTSTVVVQSWVSPSHCMWPADHVKPLQEQTLHLCNCAARVKPQRKLLTYDYCKSLTYRHMFLQRIRTSTPAA